jgi:hypothetical protein
MASPFSITDRIAEIMDSFYTGISSAVVRYYVGQKNQVTNYATNYIVFSPQSEVIVPPHINADTIDGYDYEFCFDRNITISAKCQAKNIDTLSIVISGLISAIKLTNGPAINPNVQWESQFDDTGVTRQGELATVNFDLLIPVPKFISQLVTPEIFESPVDFVDVLPDGYAVIINPNYENPPYYATGIIETLT